MANNQLEIELPKDYESSIGYKNAAIEFHANKKYRDKQPLFLCFNKTNKEFFVSYRFSKKTVESFKKLTIIDEHNDLPTR